jgi:long-chain acyl-CoA synthetase
LYSFKDNAAGLPLPGLEIKINNANEVGIGEIYIKGESVMLGYYKNQKLTDDAFDEGWFRTGDIGFFDEDGFLHINGRQKNVIISKSGENVFPEEIEDILNRNPFVQESMVYGEQDDKHTEIIAVQIVTDAEAFIEYSEKNKVKITPELVNDIIAEAVKETNKELPAFKQIRKFYVRDSEFEKTTTQKIKRYLVKNVS